MAIAKSLASFSSAAVLLILVAVAAQTVTVRSQAQSQSCAGDLNNLNACAPFVVPGQNNIAPSPECCSALSGMDQGCLCNTLRVASRMPAACNLPPLTCGN